MAQNPADTHALKCFLFLFATATLLVARLLWPFLSLLILSFLLTNIFRPTYDFINRYTSSTLASLLTCLLILLLVFIPLTFFVVSLSKEALDQFQYMKGINLGDKITELAQNNSFFIAAQEYLNSTGISFTIDDITQNLTEYSRTFALFLYDTASSWAANIITFIVDFALMILVIFFLLIDYDRFVKFVQQLSPLPEDQEKQLISKFQKISQAILLGNGICGLIQGVLGGILFAYFQIGSPIIWGGIMGTMAFLPIVGIGVILLPTALIFLLKGQIGQAIFIAVFYFVLSMTVEYLLKPKLVGSKVKMHTLIVFLSIIGGLSVFGVLGIIYGPLIMTAFLTLADIYKKNYALQPCNYSAPQPGLNNNTPEE
jgi:predicted PurR-regulated permease PerM